MRDAIELLTEKSAAIDEIFDIMSRISVLLDEENLLMINKCNQQLDERMKLCDAIDSELAGIDSGIDASAEYDERCGEIRKRIQSRLIEIDKTDKENQNKAQAYIDIYKDSIRQINEQRKSEMQYGAASADEGFYIDTNN